MGISLTARMVLHENPNVQKMIYQMEKDFSEVNKKYVDDESMEVNVTYFKEIIPHIKVSSKEIKIFAIPVFKRKIQISQQKIENKLTDIKFNLNEKIFDIKGKPIPLRMIPFNGSKYQPHQGKQEIERRKSKG